MIRLMELVASTTHTVALGRRNLGNTYAPDTFWQFLAFPGYPVWL